jgi:hypothetical protein
MNRPLLRLSATKRRDLSSWFDARPFQITLAQMIAWVCVAAFVCFCIRNAVVALPGLAIFLALVTLFRLWDRLWDWPPMRAALFALFLVVIIPFSPVLLFCLPWERLAERWRLLWRRR